MATFVSSLRLCGDNEPVARNPPADVDAVLSLVVDIRAGSERRRRDVLDKSLCRVCEFTGNGMAELLLTVDDLGLFI